MSDAPMTSAIQVTFPVPVELSREHERALHDLLSDICKSYEAARPDRTMWVMGWGGLCTSMPITAEDEREGVPLSFDMSVLHAEISERENYKWPCHLCGGDAPSHWAAGARDHEYEPKPVAPPTPEYGDG